MWNLIAPAAAIFLTLALNRLASGRGLWRSPGRFGELTALLLATSGLCLAAALTARPGLSGLLVLCAAALLWRIDTLKRTVLREPLVFSDLGLLPDILRSPEFYFPHLPIVPTVGAVLGAALLLAGTLWLETPRFGWEKRLVLATMGLLPFLHLYLAAHGRFAKLVRYVLTAHPLAFASGEDVGRHGPAGAFVLHLLSVSAPQGAGVRGLPPSERGESHAVWPKEVFRPLPHRKPHLVLVQAESFCDLRRTHPGLDRELLARFDDAASEGLSGRFAAPGYGAYTMRTEFAVLSGLPPAALGVACFNPYLFVARHSAWSLARHLRGQGYAALALHPNDPRFFRRDQVFPNLGFEGFLSSRDFAGAERFGPYVSDAAVAGRVLEILAACPRPCFCFAITMEAHGPWLPGRLDAYGSPGGDPLALYARHLRNADRMLGQLLEGFVRLNRPVVLGLYGDHVGSLPGAQEPGADGAQDHFTDYLVHAPGAWRAGERRILSPEELGGVLLSAMHG